MPLREDILDPIAGDNPSGIDLRRDAIYDKIKEARRRDDDLAQGAWVTERKVADFPTVLRLAQDSIATTSKDLQLAAWLTEALIYTERFAGLRQGLDLCRRLVAEFWDTLYPEVEDGDREMRAKPLIWIGYALDIPLRSVPLVEQGSFSWISYQESRTVGYEDQAKTEKERSSRTKLIDKEKKLPPEVFDKAVAATAKAFYAQAEKDLDSSLFSLAALEKTCEEKFEDDAPSFGKFKTSIEEVRRTVHSLLEKKRLTEPDPAVEEPVAAQQSAEDASSSETSSDPAPASSSVVYAKSVEPADRREAIASVIAAAGFLRKREPFSPASYLLLRGLRWGELRSSTRLSDAALLEAPPTDLRQSVKRKALAADWRGLLEACEDAMSHPSSRAWLDLQRMSCTACHNLGDDYRAIEAAIKTELRALLNDLPELLEATLLDDTPAANAETKAWLIQLGSPAAQTSAPDASSDTEPNPENGSAPPWLTSVADPFALAKQVLAAGQGERAFEIMRSEIGRQRSGRGRFRRTMQLVELAIAAGKDSIAQPLLDDLAATIENHKLDAWEDPTQVASDLLQMLRSNKKLQANAAEKQKLFERICRLDAVLALDAG